MHSCGAVGWQTWSLVSVTTGLVTSDHLRLMDPSEPSIYSDGAVASGGSLLRCPFLHDLELPWAVPTAPPEVTAACPPEDQMTREQVWSVHPFGMPLLRHIVRAYEAIGDCQTLAALTCVLRMGEISELVPDSADAPVDAPKEEGLAQASGPAPS